MRVAVFGEPGYEGERLWIPAVNSWHLPILEIKLLLEDKGHTICSFPCEVDIDKDIGIYYGMPLYPCPTIKRSLSIQMEPPIVPGRARFYERMGGLPFTRILTFVREFVDNKRVFHVVVPAMPYKGELAPVRDLYICAVSGGG